jgi:3-deoxy-alpha-D-manno-octulosonate 8-oxidase
MMASYCGGMSIAYSQVGICHACHTASPSCWACIMASATASCSTTSKNFIPEGVAEFRQMMTRQRTSICPAT